jgi:DNA-binding response OmpR family regulator
MSRERAFNVIIVDDDPQVADTMADAVRLAGYEVSGIASHADEALQMATECRPRLAVVDVNLYGEGTGIDVARRLLENGPIGVVFVTGDPDSLDGVGVGHAWLPKPYRALDLINSLDVVGALSESRPVTTRVPPDLHFIESSGG